MSCMYPVCNSFALILAGSTSACLKIYRNACAYVGMVGVPFNLHLDSRKCGTAPTLYRNQWYGSARPATRITIVTLLTLLPVVPALPCALQEGCSAATPGLVGRVLTASLASLFLRKDTLLCALAECFRSDTSGRGALPSRAPRLLKRLRKGEEAPHEIVSWGAGLVW